MLLSKIFSYIKGFVTIIIEGLFPERFINVCTRNNISLTNIMRRDKTHIQADISVPDFKRLRRANAKTGCRVHIKSKHGLPFFLHRHKKRKMLLLGALLFLLALYVLTRFVWIIEVTGNEKLSHEEVISYAKKAGLYAGMYVNHVDSDAVQSYLMTNMKQIKFASVNRTGTVVNIDIREREEIREHFDASTPTNIVASQSGVIEEMLVQSGTAVVKAGDVVYKGQLLVSGAADSITLGIKYSRSDAQIKARVWHEEEVKTPFKDVQKVKTGRVKKQRKLKIFGLSVNLFVKNKILFEKYDILSYTNYISIGKDKTIPIGIETTEYTEYTETSRTLTEKELKALLTKELDEKYASCEIVSRKFKTSEGKMTVVYECIEDIAKEEEMNDYR